MTTKETERNEGHCRERMKDRTQALKEKKVMKNRGEEARRGRKEIKRKKERAQQRAPRRWPTPPHPQPEGREFDWAAGGGRGGSPISACVVSRKES